MSEKLNMNRVGIIKLNITNMILEQNKPALLFEKRMVAEVSENELESINGGSTPLQLAAAAAAVTYAGYAFGHWLYTVTH